VYEILVGFGEYFKEFSPQSTVNFLIRWTTSLPRENSCVDLD